MSKIDVTLLVILLVGFYTVISAVVYFFYETYSLCKKDKDKTMSLAALGGIDSDEGWETSKDYIEKAMQARSLDLLINHTENEISKLNDIAS